MANMIQLASEDCSVIVTATSATTVVEPIYPPGFTQELQFILQGGAQLEDNARAQRSTSLGYLLRQRKVYGLALGWGAYNYTFLLLTWLLIRFLFVFRKTTQR